MTTSSRPLERLYRVALAFVFVFGLSSANADMDAAAKDLEVCVSRHVDNEKAKSNPKAQNLLNICKKELDALVRLLPAGIEGDIKQHILSGIKDQLADS